MPIKVKRKKINPTSLLLLIKHILILSAYAHSTKHSTRPHCRKWKQVLFTSTSEETILQERGVFGLDLLWKSENLQPQATKRLHLRAETHLPRAQDYSANVSWDSGRHLQNNALLSCWWTISDSNKVCFFYLFFFLHWHNFFFYSPPLA